MDKIELNGEIYIKKSSIDKVDDKELLEMLKESNIEYYDIAEVLKDKLGDIIDDGKWIDKDDIDMNNNVVREMLLYAALVNYL